MFICTVSGPIASPIITINYDLFSVNDNKYYKIFKSSKKFYFEKYIQQSKERLSSPENKIKLYKCK